MKKILISIMMIAVSFMTAQTTPTYKNVKLTQVPLGSKVDSVLAIGADKKLKHIPRSSFATTLQQVIDAGGSAAKGSSIIDFFKYKGGNYSHLMYLEDYLDSNKKAIFSMNHGSISFFTKNHSFESGLSFSNGYFGFHIASSSGQTVVTITPPVSLSTIKFPAPVTSGVYNIPLSINGQVADEGGNITLPTGGGATDTNAVHKSGDDIITGKKSLDNSSNNQPSLYVQNSSNSSYGINISSTGGAGGLFSTNSSSGVGIASTNAGIGIGGYFNNVGSGTGLYITNQSSGYGALFSNQSIGKGLVLLGTPASTGPILVGRDNITDTFTLTKTGDITANSYIKAGGLSTEYLMADGSTTTGGGATTPTLQQVTTAGATTNVPTTFATTDLISGTISAITATSDYGRGVYATTVNGTAVYATAVNGTAVGATSDNGDAIIATSNTGTGITATSNAGTGIYAYSGTVEAGKFDISSESTSNIVAFQKEGLNLAVIHNDGRITTPLVTETAVLEYADNAAAIIAGLAMGTHYRTGDLLKIVH